MPKVLPVNVCAYCGKPFTGSDYRARFCPVHRGRRLRGEPYKPSGPHQKTQPRQVHSVKPCRKCGVLVPAHRWYCDACRPQKNHRWNHNHPRPDAAKRGYGSEHARLRRQWKLKVDRGEVHCARCGQWIEPGSPWHLDHTEDRSTYLGPSHAKCNLSAAAYKGIAIKGKGSPNRQRRRSREW